jgi:hypothetical protein
MYRKPATSIRNSNKQAHYVPKEDRRFDCAIIRDAPFRTLGEEVFEKELALAPMQ